MEKLNTSNLDKSFINYEHNSSNDFFSHLLVDNPNSDFFATKKLSECSDESTSDMDSTKSSKSIKEMKPSEKKVMSKFGLFKKPNARKDLYGNFIKKGGNHKVSFKDEIKGKMLVTMTLIDVKQSSIKGKNVKNYTIDLIAKDKKELATCTIF